MTLIKIDKKKKKHLYKINYKKIYACSCKFVSHSFHENMSSVFINGYAFKELFKQCCV